MKSREKRTMRIVFSVTIGGSAYNLLRGQLKWFKERGIDARLVTTPDYAARRTIEREGVPLHGIEMEREISLKKDWVAARNWYRLLRRIGPDAVAVGTPKAALLGSVTAALARVPVRLYVVRGLRLEGTTGVKRKLLWLAEWVTLRASTDVMFVSRSLARESKRIGLRHKKSWLVGAGSSNGVNADAVYEAAHNGPSRPTRSELGFRESDFIVGFVGRQIPDKGIGDLIEAGKNSGLRSDVRFLVIGSQDDPVLVERLQSLGSRAKVLPWVPSAWPYMGIMDVLCLPTRREGFPNVVLEASAAGLPTITTNATGAIDSVIEGTTGYRVDTGDSQAIVDRVNKLAADPQLARSLGNQARQRVLRSFKPEDVWNGYLEILTGESHPRQARRFDPSETGGDQLEYQLIGRE